MGLRVSLLIVGGLIVLIIYLIGRYYLPKEERHASMPREKSWSDLFKKLRDRLPALPQEQKRNHDALVTPVLDPGELEQLEQIIPDRSANGVQSDEIPVILELGSEQIAPSGEQLFIPLTLMAKFGQSLTGESISHATKSLGMVLKDDGIYRYEVKDGQGYRQPLLGLANILEPGTFVADQLGESTTPGLVLYLHLPAPIEAREAFDKLIDVGQELEQLLEAELCDETRSVLTKQTIGHLKEKVESFRFKQKMTSLQRRRT